MNTSASFTHFLQQLDAVGYSVLSILLLMSVGCWCLILRKLIELMRSRRNARRAWCLLRQARLDESYRIPGDFGELLGAGLLSHRRWQLSLVQGAGATIVGDPLERALGQQLTDSGVRHERGLTFLACVSAGSPFVGLFGTVMGIYHALTVIGASGESGLEQVAGPVGEALLMTACGLACAIPAVLAYNFFARANRNRMAELERFAHELHAGLTLGSFALKEGA